MDVAPPGRPTTRRRWALLGLLGFAAIAGISVVVGYVGTPTPSERPPPDFDWELFALILTGLGTTALAVVPGCSRFRPGRTSEHLPRWLAKHERQTTSPGISRGDDRA